MEENVTCLPGNKNGISDRLLKAALKKQKLSCQASNVCRESALRLISAAESDEAHEGT